MPPSDPHGQAPDPQDPDSDYEAPDPGHSVEWKGRHPSGETR